MAFFFTLSDPCMETDPFFFPPVSGNSWKAKATSWVGEETGEVLTCRQAGDPGKSHRQEEPDWLWPPRSRLGARQLKDVSKPHSDHHRVLQEIAQKYCMLRSFIACSFVLLCDIKCIFALSYIWLICLRVTVCNWVELKSISHLYNVKNSICSVHGCAVTNRIIDDGKCGGLCNRVLTGTKAQCYTAAPVSDMCFESSKVSSLF